MEKLILKTLKITINNYNRFIKFIIKTNIIEIKKANVKNKIGNNIFRYMLFLLNSPENINIASKAIVKNAVKYQKDLWYFLLFFDKKAVYAPAIPLKIISNMLPVPCIS
jgi:hypothetical protein